MIKTKPYITNNIIIILLNYISKKYIATINKKCKSDNLYKPRRNN